MVPRRTIGFATNWYNVDLENHQEEEDESIETVEKCPILPGQL